MTFVKVYWTSVCTHNAISKGQIKNVKLSIKDSCMTLVTGNN